MAMATAHAFMISEHARQGARLARFVDDVPVRALSGPRYHVPVPRLLECHSTSAQGAPAANTASPSFAGVPGRTPESLLGTTAAAWCSQDLLDSMATAGARPLVPAACSSIALTTLSVLRTDVQWRACSSRRTRRIPT